MVVNPYCVYAYWSISKRDLIRAYERLKIKKHTQFILRFYDLTAGNLAASSSFDVAVPGEARHWYVDLWTDNKHYQIELGLVNCDGCFVALACSNPVETPRARPEEPVEAAVFMGHDTQLPAAAKTFPLEFSLSPEERAARAQALIARHFPLQAEAVQTPSQEKPASPPSQWSASLPKRSS